MKSTLSALLLTASLFSTAAYAADPSVTVYTGPIAGSSGGNGNSTITPIADTNTRISNFNVRPEEHVAIEYIPGQGTFGGTDFTLPVAGTNTNNTLTTVAVPGTKILNGKPDENVAIDYIPGTGTLGGTDFTLPVAGTKTDTKADGSEVTAISVDGLPGGGTTPPTPTPTPSSASIATVNEQIITQAFDPANLPLISIANSAINDQGGAVTFGSAVSAQNLIGNGPAATANVTATSAEALAGLAPAAGGDNTQSAAETEVTCANQRLSNPFAAAASACGQESGGAL